MITKFLLWTTATTLVLCDKISFPWVSGSRRTWASNRGTPSKKDVILPLLARLLWKRLQIGTGMVLIITSTGNEIFRFINTDDLERPWTFKRGVLMNFPQLIWLQRTFQQRIATQWLEINQDNLRMKFSALNANFNSLRPDNLGSKRLAYSRNHRLERSHTFSKQKRVRPQYSYKLAYHNKH